MGRDFTEVFSDYMAQNPIIETKDLTIRFGGHVAVNHVNLQIFPSTFKSIIGPNGAGKSTTVRILSTLLRPDSGEVLVGGFDVVKEPQKVRQIIGLTSQFSAIDEYLTGRENLFMMGRLNHLGGTANKKKTEDILTQFELTDTADRNAKTYSGGMKRRLDLALSLISTPPIIFLDEPTTGLDPRSRLLMWQLIEYFKKLGTTILLTTQNLEEADKLADRIAVLDRGKIIALGTAAELKKQVGTEHVEVIVDTPGNFQKALQIFGPEISQLSEEEKKFSISTDGSVKAVKRILDLLYDKNIEIDNLSVHQPTLDDVFLNFTGREVENSAQENNNSTATNHE